MNTLTASTGNRDRAAHYARSRGDDVQDLLDRLDGVRTAGADKWIARCPAHHDQSPSLSIARGADGRLLAHCFAGCEFGDILAAVGIERGKTDAPRLALRPRLIPPAPTQAPILRPVDTDPAGAVAKYIYTDEAGNVLFRKVRFQKPGEKKKIVQHVYRGGSWWTGDGCLNGVRRTLYHWPRLIGAKTVWIVEGEKCADALVDFGYAATCTSEGCHPEGWRPEFTEAMRGRRVFVLPDNDIHGLPYARHVAREVARVAAECRIVELPGLANKEDVFDWLEREGGSAA